MSGREAIAFSPQPPSQSSLSACAVDGSHGNCEPGSAAALPPLHPCGFRDLVPPGRSHAEASSPNVPARSTAPEAEWQRDRNVAVSQLLNLIIALRTNRRFSSQERFVECGREGNHPLMVAAKRLRRMLLCPPAPRLPAADVMHPFIEVVRSHDAPGPITGVALSALSTFVELSLSFIDADALTTIAQATENAQIEVVDAQAHEAVLARILQLRKAVACHKCAVQLSEQDILRILRGCFTIGMSGSPSELLRHAAEQTKTEIVAVIFSRVVSGETQHSFSGVFEYAASLVATEAESYWSLFPVTPMVQSPPPEDSDRPFRSQVAETKFAGLTLAYHILATLREAIREPHCVELLAVLRDEMSRALLKVTQTVDNVVVVSQMLRTLQLAWTFAADAIVPQFLTFMLATMLKPVPDARQLRVPAGDGFQGPHPHGFFAAAERSEVVLESLLELCSDPVFPVYLYRHYDLDLLSPNVFGRLCEQLSQQCFPTDGRVTVLNMLAANCLLALLSGVQSRSLCSPRDVHLQHHMARELIYEKKSELRHLAGLFKDKPKAAINKLRSLPVGPDGRNIFGLTATPAGHEVGLFLYAFHRLFDMQQLGDYISEEGRPGKPAAGESEEEFRKRDEAQAIHTEGHVRYHESLRKGFYSKLPLKGKTLLGAMRTALNCFRLPGEAQKIDRLMEELSVLWFNENSHTGADGERDHHINPFKSPDACFVFTFSVIMLNTDLHSNQVQNKMTLEQFVRNNRGTNDGADVPLEYQQMVYEEILRSEIKMQDAVLDVAADDFLWDHAVHHSKEVAAKVADEPTQQIAASGELERHIFETLCQPAIAGLLAVIDGAEQCDAGAETIVQQTGTNEAIIVDALGGLRRVASIASRFGMTGMLDSLVVALCKLTGGLQPAEGSRSVARFGRGTKGILACCEVFALVREQGMFVRDAWKDVMGLVTRLYLLGCLPEQREAAAVHFPGPGATAQATPTTPGSASQSPVMSLYNDAASPMLAQPPAERPRARQHSDDDPSAEDSWLGALFGPSEQERQKREALMRAACMRVHNRVRECRVTDLLLRDLAGWDDDVLLSVLQALIAVSGVRLPEKSEGDGGALAEADGADREKTCFAVHMLAEICVNNGHRYKVATKHVGNFFARLMLTSAARVMEARRATTEQAMRREQQRAAFWKVVGENVAFAQLRMFVRLSWNRELVTDLVLALRVFNSLHHAVFSNMVAPHIANAFSIVVSSPALEHLLDAETCELFVKLTEKAGTLAGDTAARLCAGVLRRIVSSGRFAWPDNVPSLVRSVVHLFLLNPLATESEESNDAAPPSAAQQPPSPEHPSARLSSTKAVDTVASLQHRLLQSCPSLREPDPKWAEAWLAALQGLANIVAAPLTPGGPPGRPAASVQSSALHQLERAVLSDRCTELPPGLCFEVMGNVVLPLVERRCELPKGGAAPAAQGAGEGLLSRLNASAVVSAVFGAAMADPDVGQRQGSQHGTALGKQALEDLHLLQSRVVGLPGKFLLHVLPQLASDPAQFIPLWKRLLGMLAAYCGESQAAPANESVRDAACEYIKNMVFVASAGSSAQELARVGGFWELTRDLLAPFGPELCKQLRDRLDAQGLGRGASPAIPPPPPPPPRPPPVHA